MQYKIGQKVWVSNQFSHKKIVDIEYHDGLILLYMDDITAYPENEVFKDFFSFLKSKKKYFIRKTRIKKVNNNDDYKKVVDFFKKNYFDNLSKQDMDKLYKEMWG